MQYLKNYTIKDGLVSNSVKKITQDNIGYLWFSSGKNLTQYNGLEFKNIELKNEQINILKTKKDSLLIGSDTEFSIQYQNKITTLESKKILSILVTEETIFVGTTQGFYLLKEGYLSPQKTNYQIDLNRINDIKFDGKNYWIATNKALWKLDRLIKPTSIKRIEEGNFQHILQDKEQIITTTKSTVFTIENSKNANPVYSGLQTISAFKKIKNQYWAATKNNGITVLNEDFSFDRNINKYNTFVTNNINDIFEDKQKNIWIATDDKGIYKLESPHKKVLKPLLNLSKIEVVYENLDSININNYKRVLQLPSNKNHVSFSYNSININQPKNIEYRYKLNGKFSPWSIKKSVDFANLSAGNYTFLAQSKIDNLESKPLSFSFYIDKPIYQKSWFLWSLLGLLSLIFGLLIYFYIKRIKKKNKAKVEKLKLENHLLSLEQKALQLQMNPHFIFNVLNGIKALGSSGKTIELNQTVSKFATLLRGVLNNSRAEEISLNEEISTLKNYIELEQQMSSKPFNFTIKTDLSLDAEEILIPPMLLQPFVENAIKHGVSSKENGEIIIKFSTKNNFLECSIDDNGIGFEKSKKQKIDNNHKSLAVKVTQERIENLSKESKFSIKELKEKEEIIGTRVWFKVPLKTDF